MKLAEGFIGIGILILLMEIIWMVCHSLWGQ